MGFLTLLFSSDWLIKAARIFGGVLAVGYVLQNGADLQFSLAWSFGFIAIAVSVGWLMVLLNLDNRFPELRRHLVYAIPNKQETPPVDERERARRKAERLLRSAWGGWLVLLTPAEDGLICIPLVVAGITPFTALIGGLIFGFLHLRAYSYFECLGKAIYYTIACYVILPHGFLSVVAGHFALDAVFLVVLMQMRRQGAAMPDQRK